MITIKIHNHLLKTKVMQLIRNWANDGDMVNYTAEVDDNEDLLTEETR